MGAATRCIGEIYIRKEGQYYICEVNDEVYLGKLIWNKTKKRIGSNNTSSYVLKDEWIVVENCHEPIITQEVFDKAHANSKKCNRAKRGKRNYNPFF